MQAIPSSRTSWSSKGVRAALGAVALAWAPLASAAATVEPELALRLAREAGLQRYPVILRLAQQPDPAQLAQKVQGLPQGQRGGKLLEALKARAKPKPLAKRVTLTLAS